ncbi:TspO and MBR like protein [endosymbiont of Acanthamoeba sp. UWC8]|uniref:TspO/MBR family protein n=1 Tax=endosymbiont of Acanthamoeba sp. UWC8 TaxID=86106 RepID=UPI0004D0F51E|nr:TspO/MBR family protein [endosymbiont of Acanthamoeba sp. UWC8]AIF81168.1 TspO and MBR like protein [endosymbiont of Acanthamoeba sp. UWC8]
MSIKSNKITINIYKPYFICVSLCLIIGGLAAVITKLSEKDWYTNLLKPGFTPPNWLFGPVWLILYIIIGIAWGHINKIDRSNTIFTKQNICFVIQLALNCTWSYIYFGAHKILYAWLDLTLLWFTVIITMYYFFNVSKFSGLLLIPYFIWITYANVLNVTIWYLNK